MRKLPNNWEGNVKFYWEPDGYFEDDTHERVSLIVEWLEGRCPWKSTEKEIGSFSVDFPRESIDARYDEEYGFGHDFLIPVVGYPNISDPNMRGRGLGIEMYRMVIAEFGVLRSFPTSTSPEARRIWTKLTKQYPSRFDLGPEQNDISITVFHDILEMERGRMNKHIYNKVVSWCKKKQKNKDFTVLV